MGTSAIVPPESGRYRRVAAPLHTVLVLAASGAWAWRGVLNAGHLRGAGNLNRIGMYGRTMLFEWLLFGFVLLGVKLNGTPLRAVLGERWSSVRQVLRRIPELRLHFGFLDIIVTSLLGAATAPGGGPISRAIPVAAWRI